MNRKVLLHAVIRHDEYMQDITLAVTVVAVVPSREEADQEVERLNALNAGKGCRYFWTPARYYPDGKGVEPDTRS